MNRDRSIFWTVAGFPVRAIRALPRTLLALLVIGGLVLNVATLTSPRLNALATSALSEIGVTTVAERERRAMAEQHATELAAAEAETRAAEDAKLKAEEAIRAGEATIAAIETSAAGRAEILRDLAGGIADRARLGVARSADSAQAEAIPFLGATAVTATLSQEIADACDSARDAAVLDAIASGDGEPEGIRVVTEAEFDCRATFGDAIDVPTAEKTWQQMSASPEQAWAAAAPYLGEAESAPLPADWDVLAERARSVFAAGELELPAEEAVAPADTSEPATDE